MNAHLWLAGLSGRSKTIMKGLGLALLCLALSACGGSDDEASGDEPYADQPVPGPVRGKVTLNAPVVGAVVSLQTHDG